MAEELQRAKPAPPNGPGAGRVVLVTGASSGIGRATALHLYGLGFTVYAGVRKNEDAESLRADAFAIRPVIIDVTDTSTITSAADEIRKSTGHCGMYGLVNNAGICVVGPVETLSIDDIRRQLDVNVVGQIAVTQAFLPLLRQTGGRVVIMGSIFGLLSCPYVGAYAASKHALEAIADALRVELAPWRIHVTIIEPGRMATSIWDKSIDSMQEPRGTRTNVEVQELYATSTAAALTKSLELARTSASPDRVARAVARALTASVPRTRYRVGRDVRFWVPARRILPDRLCDWVIKQMLKA